MKILINGFGSKLHRWWPSPYLGALFSPSAGNSIKPIVQNSVPWAADNDCFTGFNEQKYRKMLIKLVNHPGCLFVTAPDKVKDGKETLSLFEVWQPVLRAHHLPVALVAQDGMSPSDIEWGELDWIFIGGSTEFKVGKEGKKIIDRAKEENKKVHVGRVSTHGRIKYCLESGVDTIDGTRFSWFDKKLLGAALDQIHNFFCTERVACPYSDLTNGAVSNI